jgi:hypothetical protein
VRRRVGKRTYVSESAGVAGPLGARRVGKGVLMVSAERSRELEAVFEGLGVAHTRARVWE